MAIGRIDFFRQHPAVASAMPGFAPPVPAFSVTANAANPADSRFLGGPAQLSVSWHWDDGQTVVVQLHSMITLPAYRIHICRLSMKAMPACRFRMSAQIIGPQERDVRFQLGHDPGGRPQLRADIPVGTKQWFRDVLSVWMDPLGRH